MSLADLLTRYQSIRCVMLRRDIIATLEAATLDYATTFFSRHTLHKTVHTSTLTSFWLIRSFRHTDTSYTALVVNTKNTNEKAVFYKNVKLTIFTHEY